MQNSNNKITYVAIITDSSFDANYRATDLKKRALRALAQRTNSLLAEISDLSKAEAVFSVYRTPGSKSFFLRKQGIRNYEERRAAAEEQNPTEWQMY